jgi:hypothetical protein
MGFAHKFKNLFRKQQPRLGLAISGGGSKAFYSLGMMTYFQEKGIRFDVYAGTSAGAAMIISDATRQNRDTLNYFVTMVRNNPKNFYLENLLKPGKSPFPHLQMYKKGIRYLLNFEKLKKAARERQFFIPCVVIRESRYGRPHQSFYRASILFYLSMQYFRDRRDLSRRSFRNLLEKNAEKLNLKEVVFTERDFTSPAMVEKIILASSSAPPILKTQQIGNNWVLDGALISNVPLDQLEGRVDLPVGVLYHSGTVDHYKQRFPDSFLCYPRVKLPVETYEYADADAIEQAFKMGYEDGRFYYPRLKAEIQAREAAPRKE